MAGPGLTVRVGIATIQVPFVRGWAESVADRLLSAIRAAGHEAEIITVPFIADPPRRIPEAMALCRMLDLGGHAGMRIDRLIGLTFPAYLIPHPSKVLWLLHQHRSAYELWDTPHGDLRDAPDGQHVRTLIHGADTRLIAEAQACYTVSHAVSQRLQAFCGLDSTPVHHPPPSAPAFDGVQPGWDGPFLWPGPAVRQGLVLDAMARTRHPVRMVVIGAAPPAGHPALDDRITWLGDVPEAERVRLYAECRAVILPATGEAYGYTTLEAMLASKAVITCRDNDAALEFVAHGSTGLVCEPNPAALAEALDRLWEQPATARAYGLAARARYVEMGIGWPAVLDRLLG